MKVDILKILFAFCCVLLAIILIIVVILKVNNKNKYTDLIFVCADNYNIERSLILSIVKVESNFNEKAVSSRNACGLMQLTPSTFDFMQNLYNRGENLDIFNAKDNVKMGCLYIKYLRQKFDSIETVLCAYNAGEGNVKKWLNDANYSKDGKNLAVIPFTETSNYVKKVLFYKKYYERYDL